MTPADPSTIARNLAAARRFVEGVVVDTGLNPLMHETWQAPAMTPLLLGTKA